MKKILIVTPRSPFQGRGADEQERLGSVKWFKRNGFDVRVITKTMDSDIPHLDQARSELGIKITPISYKFQNKKSFGDKIKRVLSPWLWDGAAAEYFEPEIRKELEQEIISWRPDLVWFDFTYLWPLHGIARKYKIPVVTRSINFEPRHYLEEEGTSLFNWLVYGVKFLSEMKSAQSTDYMLALNPNEEKKYKRLGTKNVMTLPLQVLPEKLNSHESKERKPLNVLFMGSSYSVGHNLEALKFVIHAIAPTVFKKSLGDFIFHITGTKFPKDYEKYIDGKNIIYDGYIPKENLDDYFKSIDLAISPSKKIVGMQGKVFEPLARSLPLITSSENVVGYPFINKESVLFAKTKEEYAELLLSLRDVELRKKIGDKGGEVSRNLFSSEKIDGIMYNLLDRVNLT